MVAVIDYKAGNAPSVLNALRHLGAKSFLASAPGQLAAATHIILPGVGAAGATMASLRDSGMLEALQHAVLREGRYFLGVCVGMQILFERSEEGDAACMGWLRGEVARFPASGVKVPQMGWNRVDFRETKQTDDPCSFPCGGNYLPSVHSDYFYFVNSYYACPADSTDVWGTSAHGVEFTAAVAHENIYGTQFHIEKSGPAGLSLLSQFVSLGGAAKC